VNEHSPNGRRGRTRTFAKAPPVAVLAAAAAAQLLLARGRRTSAMSVIESALVAALALGLLIGSLVGFRRQRTTVDPLVPGRATSLVVTGPNAVTRNPMYVGMAGVLLAHAVARRSLPGLVPLAGFVVWMDRLQIPPEEAALEATFGDEYRRYARHVPRWLGGTPGRQEVLGSGSCGGHGLQMPQRGRRRQVRCADGGLQIRPKNGANPSRAPR